MLNVTNDAFLLSVVMLRVVMLSVVAPPKHLKLLLKANGGSTIGKALH
jgi:hypothetical protein